MSSPLRDDMARPNWLTDEIVSRLGTAFDRDIAEEYGVQVSRVAHARRQRAISAYAPTPRHPELIARLGSKTDSALATEFGLHPETVRRLRKRLGVPTATAKKRANVEEHLLGFLPDQMLAERAGVSYDVVRTMRHRAGLQGYDRTVRRLWESGFFHDLRSATDAELTQRHAVPSEAVQHLRCLSEEAERTPKVGALALRTIDRYPDLKLLIGIGSTSSIAADLGVSAPAVHTARRALGTAFRGRDHFARHPDLLPLLRDPGLSAKQIAAKAGVSPATVRRARARRSIQHGRKLKGFRHVELDDLEAQRLLGWLPDKVISKRIGVSATQVARARRSAEVKSWRRRLRLLREGGVLRQLGLSAEELAERFELPIATAAYLKERWGNQ